MQSPEFPTPLKRANMTKAKNTLLTVYIKYWLYLQLVLKIRAQAMQFRCERLYMNIRLVACYLIQKSQSSVLMALLIHRLCYQKKGVIHVISKESIFSFETDYLIALRLMMLIILLLSFLGDGKLLIEVIQQAISLYLISKIAFLAPIIVVLFIPTS